MLSHFCGIDSGSSATKVVIFEREHGIAGSAVVKSGVDFAVAAVAALQVALAEAGIAKESIAYTIASGYGRNNIPADETKTEIACHGKGCHRFFPREITIVDIGAQDSKIIKLDGGGRRKSFKMNRKCAAGTGAFLEEMANRLDVPLDDLDRLARGSTDEVVLGSYCTVFTATEILGNIRAGFRLEDIIKGIFRSVIKRILEMDTLAGEVILSGGVAAGNPILAGMLKEQGVAISLPPCPQLMGALGAALFAIDASNDREGS